MSAPLGSLGLSPTNTATNGLLATSATGRAGSSNTENPLTKADFKEHPASGDNAYIITYENKNYHYI